MLESYKRKRKNKKGTEHGNVKQIKFVEYLKSEQKVQKRNAHDSMKH